MEEKLSHEVLSLKMELSKVRQTANFILWSKSLRKIYFQKKCDFKDVFIVQLHLHCIAKPCPNNSLFTDPLFFSSKSVEHG